MGLFKKRETDPAEIERLKAEIALMGARLDASEAAKSELVSTVHGLATRLDTSTPPPPTPPAPVLALAPPGPAESGLDELNARIEHLAAHVGEAPATAVDLARVDQLAEQVEHLAARVDDASAPAIEPEQVEQLTSQVQRIGARIDEIDQRITSISTELANQITELSGDIDAAGNRVPTDAIVDELRDAQTRLAGEQARYQIAFRQDLADLADRLKRS